MEALEIRVSSYLSFERFIILLIIFILCNPTFRNYTIAQNETIELTIAYTHDIHSHLYSEWTDNGCKGGMPLLATKIQQLRQERPVLLLDCGDTLSGGAINDHNGGIPMIEVMNAIGYDAMAIDNHEFDQGLGTLNEMCSKAEFEILSANTNWPDPVLKQDYSIEEVAGFQIGVIGLTPSFWYAPDDVVFEDLAESATEAVLDLKSQGINFIILLGCIYAELANSVPDVDIIMKGGGPSYIGNTLSVPSIDSYSSAFGMLNLTIDVSEGTIESYSFNEVKLDSSIQSNSSIEDIIDKWNTPLTDVLDIPIGWFDTDYTQADIGLIMAAALRNFTGADMGLYNYGGVRYDITKGFVTYRSLYYVEPFFNYVSTIEVPGNTAELLETQFYSETSITEFNSQTTYTIASSNFSITQIETFESTAMNRIDFKEISVVDVVASYISIHYPITNNNLKDALSWITTTIDSLPECSFKEGTPTEVRLVIIETINDVINALDSDEHSEALLLIDDAIVIVSNNIVDSCPRRWIVLNLNCVAYCLLPTTTTSTSFPILPEAIVIIAVIATILLIITFRKKFYQKT